MRNPCGTVGRNPAGGFATSGALPTDFVANGAGSFGFWPWVTCAGVRPGRKNGRAKARMFRVHIAVAFQKIENYSFALYNASGGRPGSMCRRFAQEAPANHRANIE
jgi:hypothetical protein